MLIAFLCLLGVACVGGDVVERVRYGAQPLLTSADCPPGYNVIVAGPTDVTVNGTNGSDCIIGNDLNNTLRGRGGADFIAGGLGDDLILGGNADDELYGEDGLDDIRGGGGSDIIDGGLDNDTIGGGSGQDVIAGGQGDDDIRGQGGADTIDGGLGNDTISGGAGADFLDGGVGDDIIDGNGGADVIEGGEGDDTIDGGAQADNIHGGPGDDVICGGGGTDIISGGGGNDTLKPNGGNEGMLTLHAALNDPPVIDDLFIAPSKFITVCEQALITVNATDINNDPITYQWSVITEPMGAAVTLLPSGAQATFSTDTDGAYELLVVAEDFHGATTQLSFPMHASPCP